MIEGAQALLNLPGRANPIFLEGKLLPLRAETAQVLNLRDGQIVQANLQLRGDQPWLILRGQALPLPPGSPRLQQGPVWLQVRQSEQGWQLQPMPAPTASSDPTQALVSRLNQLLFRPPAQPDTLNLLQSGALPRLLDQIDAPDLQQLWQNWQLQMGKLGPGDLARAVAGALGQEVWLARGQPPTGADPRQLLRKLVQWIKDSRSGEEGPDALRLDELLRPIEASLDQLESQQVQAAQAQAQQELLLSLTLPFRDADPVEIEFRRPARQGDERPPLTVNLHTRSEDLGEIWLQTQLSGLRQIDLRMWALREEVARMAREQSPRLSAMLGEAGLDMHSMQVMHGARPAPAQDWRPSGRGLVVDLAA